MKLRLFHNKKWISVFFIFFFSCFRFYIHVEPGDAVILINGKNVNNNTVYKSDTNQLSIKVSKYGYKEKITSFRSLLPIIKHYVNIVLEKENFNVTIETINGKSEIYLDNEYLGLSPVSLSLSYGEYNLTLKRKDFVDQKALLFVRRDGKYYLKHHKYASPVKIIGVFECGYQPKQIIFSPDDKILLISLLDDNGYDVFDLETFNLRHIAIEKYGVNKGFVEVVCIKERNTLLISQMSLNKIYEFSIKTQQLLRIFETHGLWSKFIAVCENKNIVAVSNWFSNNISIIEYTTGKLLTMIDTDKSPRGLAFDRNGTFLYTTCFDGGTILKIDTSKWVITGRIKKEKAAMRHIVLTNDNKRAFVSDMHNCCVYEIDLINFEIIGFYKVYDNPNTIALTPNNRYLFVSCRGPNDPENYLKRSPEDGVVIAIDLLEKKVKYKIDAGNQPTGLSISNDGRFLVFTNFRDNNFELYYIGDFE